MGVVEGERGAHCALDAVALHQRLGAVVTCAHSDTELVEQYPRVVVVGVADKERYDGCFVGSRAIDAQPRYAEHGVGGMHEQFVFVRGNVVDADAVHIVHGRAECRRADIVGRAGLEFIWQVGPRGAAETYVAYHLATALVRGHRLEQFATAIEHAHTGGPVHLVRRKGIEISPECLDIYVLVGNSLCPVHAD